MDELSSTEFRKSFARLTKPTVVTVNGHVMGQWIPASQALPPANPDLIGTPEGPLRTTNPKEYSRLAALQDQERFNSQPFTGPIPKVRKP